MLDSVPTISVVTPCRNSATTIEAAIKSVRHQGYPNVEHIVVEGASVDGTREVLARHPHIVVISEPDRGVYDALNKGLSRASGDVVIFVNSDDLLRDGALEAIGTRFQADPDIDVLCGGATVFGESPDGARTAVASYATPEAIDLSPQTITRGVPIINAKAFRRGFLLETGPFDTTYQFAADRDLLMRMLLKRPRVKLLYRILYEYRLHDTSLTLRQTPAAWEGIKLEHIALARKYWRICRERPDLAAHLRKWHAEEVAKLSWRKMRSGAIVPFLRLAVQALRFDPLWPVYSVMILIERSLRSRAADSGRRGNSG